MKTVKGFVLLDKNEIRTFLAACVVNRTIREIQNHHTYLPDYKSYNRYPDPLKWLESMKQYHVVNNGWSDIAQNITTFPDGTLAICRPLSQPPTGIKGHNAQGICMEHLGNFDTGHDMMTPEHKDTIIHLNAALIERFKLNADTTNIVYHHWFHEKTCPGTGFFGGNSRGDATAGFLPLVQAEYDRITKKTGPAAAEEPPARGYRLVTATALNVRSGPGSKNPKTGVVHGGALLPVFDEKSGWARISPTEQHWVCLNYLLMVRKANVLADTLNIRTGPGTDYPVIGTFARGSGVIVYESESGWCRIDPNEKWVSGKYLE